MKKLNYDSQEIKIEDPTNIDFENDFYEKIYTFLYNKLLSLDRRFNKL